MIRPFLLVVGLTGLAMADAKLELKDLPPAVRKTVEAETKGATIKNIVNSKTVNFGTDSSHTFGKIQLQSEGAEILIRRVELRPLKR